MYLLWSVNGIIGNDNAEQKILIPEVIEKLENLYDGPKAGFETFLENCFFNLHYEPKKDVVPLSLGLGRLWKLAVDHPGQQAFPCIHRAPVEHDEYRLVLIC